jgi:hypothetical protein
MLKRVAVVVVGAVLLLPSIAFAYVRLGGVAKVAVVRGSYLYGPGGGVQPPSNAAIYACFDAWRSTANPKWAITSFDAAHYGERQCKRWASNGWEIMRLNRVGRWIPDVGGDETSSCHIRGYPGQPSVPVAVARDFFGRRCHGYPHG